MPTLTPNRKPALAALCAFVALLTALAAASGSAARIPRQQLAACMRASHYQMPPTQTELANPKFTTALQRCLTKQHITTPTAKSPTFPRNKKALNPRINFPPRIR